MSARWGTPPVPRTSSDAPDRSAGPNRQEGLPSRANIHTSPGRRGLTASCGPLFLGDVTPRTLILTVVAANVAAKITPEIYDR